MTTFLVELVVFTVWLPKFIEVGFTEAPGIPTGKATVDQFVLAPTDALVQLAVAVFKIVPAAVLASLTTIVMVSVSWLATELIVTVTALLPLWQTPCGELEQLLKVSDGSRLSTTVTGPIAAAVLLVTTVV
jgi:hypothetical protein